MFMPGEQNAGQSYSMKMGSTKVWQGSNIWVQLEQIKISFIKIELRVFLLQFCPDSCCLPMSCPKT